MNGLKKLKRVISLVSVLSILALSAAAYANDTAKNSISYKKALEIMEKNNRTIKNAGLERQKMLYTHNDQVQTASYINLEGMNINIYGFNKFISWQTDQKVGMKIQKEYVTALIKNGMNLTEKSEVLTKNALGLALRDVYMGLLAGSRDYNMKLSKYELDKKKHEVGKLRYERGLISDLEYEEVKYEFLKSQKVIDEANRSLENMKRTFNSFIGVSLDTRYENPIYEETKQLVKLKPVEDYIDKALKERIEIVSISEDIKLKELYLSILETDRANEIYVRFGKEYQKTKRELESLKIKLEKAKLEVENNIKKAYIDIKKESFNVESMLKTLDMQKRSLERVKLQYKQGLVAKIMVEEFEFGIKELSNGYDLVLYGYNTKLKKLEAASGIGPAYQ